MNGEQIVIAILFIIVIYLMICQNDTNSFKMNLNNLKNTRKIYYK